MLAGLIRRSGDSAQRNLIKESTALARTQSSGSLSHSTRVAHSTQLNMRTTTATAMDMGVRASLFALASSSHFTLLLLPLLAAFGSSEAPTASVLRAGYVTLFWLFICSPTFVRLTHKEEEKKKNCRTVCLCVWLMLALMFVLLLLPVLSPGKLHLRRTHSSSSIFSSRHSSAAL